MADKDFFKNLIESMNQSKSQQTNSVNKTEQGAPSTSISKTNGNNGAGQSEPRLSRDNSDIESYADKTVNSFNSKGVYDTLHEATNTLGAVGTQAGKNVHSVLGNAVGTLTDPAAQWLTDKTGINFQPVSTFGKNLVGGIAGDFVEAVFRAPEAVTELAHDTLTGQLDDQWRDFANNYDERRKEGENVISAAIGSIEDNKDNSVALGINELINLPVGLGSGATKIGGKLFSGLGKITKSEKLIKVGSVLDDIAKGGSKVADATKATGKTSIFDKVIDSIGKVDDFLNKTNALIRYPYKAIKGTANFLAQPISDLAKIATAPWKGFIKGVKEGGIVKGLTNSIGETLDTGMRTAIDFIDKPFSYRMPRIWSYELGSNIYGNTIDPILSAKKEEEFKNEYGYGINQVAYAQDEQQLNQFYDTNNIPEDKRLTLEQVNEKKEFIQQGPVSEFFGGISDMLSIIDPNNYAQVKFADDETEVSTNMRGRIDLSSGVSVDVETGSITNASGEEVSIDDLTDEEKLELYNKGQEFLSHQSAQSQSDQSQTQSQFTQTSTNQSDILSKWMTDGMLTNDSLVDINTGKNTRGDSIYITNNINEASKQFVSSIVSMYTDAELEKNPQLREKVEENLGAWSRLFNGIAYVVNNIDEEQYNTFNFRDLMTLSYNNLSERDRKLIDNNIYKQAVDYNNSLESDALSEGWMKTATVIKRAMDDTLGDIFRSENAEKWDKYNLSGFGKNSVNPLKDGYSNVRNEVAAAMADNAPYLGTVAVGNWLNGYVEKFFGKVLPGFLTKNSPKIQSNKFYNFMKGAAGEMSSEPLENLMDAVAMVDDASTDYDFLPGLLMGMAQGAIGGYSEARSNYTSVNDYVRDPNNRDKILRDWMGINIDEIDDTQKKAQILAITNQAFDNLIPVIAEVMSGTNYGVESVLQGVILAVSQRKIGEYTTDILNQLSQAVTDIDAGRNGLDWTPEEINQVFASENDFKNFLAGNNFKYNQDFVNEIRNKAENQAKFNDMVTGIRNLVATSIKANGKPFEEALNMIAPKVDTKGNVITTPITDKKNAESEAYNSLKPGEPAVTQYIALSSMMGMGDGITTVGEKLGITELFDGKKWKKDVTITDENGNKVKMTARDFIIQRINQAEGLSPEQRSFIANVLFKTNVMGINSYFNDDGSLTRLGKDFMQMVMPSIAGSEAIPNWMQFLQRDQIGKQCKILKSKQSAIEERGDDTRIDTVYSFGGADITDGSNINDYNDDDVVVGNYTIGDLKRDGKKKIKQGNTGYILNVQEDGTINIQSKELSSKQPTQANTQPAVQSETQPESQPVQHVNKYTGPENDLFINTGDYKYDTQVIGEKISQLSDEKDKLDKSIKTYTIRKQRDKLREAKKERSLLEAKLDTLVWYNALLIKGNLEQANKYKEDALKYGVKFLNINRKDSEHKKTERGREYQTPKEIKDSIRLGWNKYMYAEMAVAALSGKPLDKEAILKNAEYLKANIPSNKRNGEFLNEYEELINEIDSKVEEFKNDSSDYLIFERDTYTDVEFDAEFEDGDFEEVSDDVVISKRAVATKVTPNRDTRSEGLYASPKTMKEYIKVQNDLKNKLPIMEIKASNAEVVLGKVEGESMATTAEKIKIGGVDAYKLSGDEINQYKDEGRFEKITITYKDGSTKQFNLVPQLSLAPDREEGYKPTNEEAVWFTSFVLVADDETVDKRTSTIFKSPTKNYEGNNFVYEVKDSNGKSIKENRTMFFYKTANGNWKLATTVQLNRLSESDRRRAYSSGKVFMTSYKTKFDPKTGKGNQFTTRIAGEDITWDGRPIYTTSDLIVDNNTISLSFDGIGMPIDISDKSFSGSWNVNATKGKISDKSIEEINEDLQRIANKDDSFLVTDKKKSYKDYYEKDKKAQKMIDDDYNEGMSNAEASTSNPNVSIEESVNEESKKRKKDMFLQSRLLIQMTIDAMNDEDLADAVDLERMVAYMEYRADMSYRGATKEEFNNFYGKFVDLYGLTDEQVFMLYNKLKDLVNMIDKPGITREEEIKYIMYSELADYIISKYNDGFLVDTILKRGAVYKNTEGDDFKPEEFITEVTNNGYSPIEIGLSIKDGKITDIVYGTTGETFAASNSDTFIHSHPNGSTFSKSDIDNAKRGGIKNIGLILPGGVFVQFTTEEAEGLRQFVGSYGGQAKSIAALIYYSWTIGKFDQQRWGDYQPLIDKLRGIKHKVSFNELVRMCNEYVKPIYDNLNRNFGGIAGGYSFESEGYSISDLSFERDMPGELTDMDVDEFFKEQQEIIQHLNDGLLADISVLSGEQSEKLSEDIKNLGLSLVNVGEDTLNSILYTYANGGGIDELIGIITENMLISKADNSLAKMLISNGVLNDRSEYNGMTISQAIATNAASQYILKDKISGLHEEGIAEFVTYLNEEFSKIEDNEMSKEFKRLYTQYASIYINPYKDVSEQLKRKAKGAKFTYDTFLKQRAEEGNNDVNAETVIQAITATTGLYGDNLVEIFATDIIENKFGMNYELLSQEAKDLVKDTIKKYFNELGVVELEGNRYNEAPKNSRINVTSLRTVNKELLSTFAKEFKDKGLISGSQYNNLVLSDPMLSIQSIEGSYGSGLITSSITRLITESLGATDMDDQSKIMLFQEIYNYYSIGRGDYDGLIKLLENKYGNNPSFKTALKSLKADAERSRQSYPDSIINLLREEPAEWGFNSDSPYEAFVKGETDDSVQPTQNEINKSEIMVYSRVGERAKEIYEKGNIPAYRKSVDGNREHTFGNPFVRGKDGTVKEVTEKFRLRLEGRDYKDMFQERREFIITQINRMIASGNIPKVIYYTETIPNSDNSYGEGVTKYDAEHPSHANVLLDYINNIIEISNAKKPKQSQVQNVITGALFNLYETNKDEFANIIKYAPNKVRDLMLTQIESINSDNKCKYKALGIVSAFLNNSQMRNAFIKESISKSKKMNSGYTEEAKTAMRTLLETWDNRALLNPDMTRMIYNETGIDKLDFSLPTVLFTGGQLDYNPDNVNGEGSTRIPMLNIDSLDGLKIKTNIIVPLSIASVPESLRKTHNIVFVKGGVDSGMLYLDRKTTSLKANNASGKAVGLMGSLGLHTNLDENFEATDDINRKIASARILASLYVDIFKHNIKPILSESEAKNIDDKAIEKLIDVDRLNPEHKNAYSFDNNLILNAIASNSIEEKINASIVLLNIVTDNQLGLKSPSIAGTYKNISLEDAINNFNDNIIGRLNDRDLHYEQAKIQLENMFAAYVALILKSNKNDFAGLSYDDIDQFAKKYDYALRTLSMLIKPEESTNYVNIKGKQYNTRGKGFWDFMNVLGISPVEEKYTDENGNEVIINKIKYNPISYLSYTNNVVEDTTEEIDVEEPSSEQISELYSEGYVSTETSKSNRLYEDKVNSVLAFLFNTTISNNLVDIGIENIIVPKGKAYISNGLQGYISNNSVIYESSIKLEGGKKEFDPEKVTKRNKRNRGSLTISKKDIRNFQNLVSTLDEQSLKNLLDIILNTDNLNENSKEYIRFNNIKESILANPSLYIKYVTKLINDGVDYNVLEDSFQKEKKFNKVKLKQFAYSVNYEVKNQKPNISAKNLNKLHEQYDRYFNLPGGSKPGDDQILGMKAIIDMYETRTGKGEQLYIPGLAGAGKTTMITAVLNYILRESGDTSGNEIDRIKSGGQTMFSENVDMSVTRKLSNIDPNTTYYFKVKDGDNGEVMFSVLGKDIVSNSKLQKEFDEGKQKFLRVYGQGLGGVWGDKGIMMLTEVKDGDNNYSTKYRSNRFVFKNITYVDSIPEGAQVLNSDKPFKSSNRIDNYNGKYTGQPKDPVFPNKGGLKDVYFLTKNHSTLQSLKAMFGEGDYEGVNFDTMDSFIVQLDSGIMNVVGYGVYDELRQSKNLEGKLIIIDESQNTDNKTLNLIKNGLGGTNKIAFLGDIHQKNQGDVFAKSLETEKNILPLNSLFRGTHDIKQTNALNAYAQQVLIESGATLIIPSDSNDFEGYYSPDDLFDLKGNTMYVAQTNSRVSQVNRQYYEYKKGKGQLSEIPVMIVDVKSENDKLAREVLNERMNKLGEGFSEYKDKDKKNNFYYKKDGDILYVYIPTMSNTNADNTEIKAVKKIVEKDANKNKEIRYLTTAFAITTAKESGKTVDNIILDKEVTDPSGEYFNEANVKQAYDASTRGKNKVYYPRMSNKIIKAPMSEINDLIDNGGNIKNLTVYDDINIVEDVNIKAPVFKTENNDQDIIYGILKKALTSLNKKDEIDNLDKLYANTYEDDNEEYGLLSADDGTRQKRTLNVSEGRSSYDNSIIGMCYIWDKYRNAIEIDDDKVGAVTNADADWMDGFTYGKTINVPNIDGLTRYTSVTPLKDTVEISDRNILTGLKDGLDDGKPGKFYNFKVTVDGKGNKALSLVPADIEWTTKEIKGKLELAYNYTTSIDKKVMNVKNEMNKLYDIAKSGTLQELYDAMPFISKDVSEVKNIFDSNSEKDVYDKSRIQLAIDEIDNMIKNYKNKKYFVSITNDMLDSIVKEDVYNKSIIESAVKDIDDMIKRYNLNNEDIVYEVRDILDSIIIEDEYDKSRIQLAIDDINYMLGEYDQDNEAVVNEIKTAILNTSEEILNLENRITYIGDLESDERSFQDGNNNVTTNETQLADYDAGTNAVEDSFTCG